MPTYEFRCRACGTTFSESRPMSESSAPATCPNGHNDTRRLLNVAGMTRSGAAAAPVSGPSGGGPAGGGCCGGCGCG